MGWGVRRTDFIQSGSQAAQPTALVVWGKEAAVGWVKLPKVAMLLRNWFLVLWTQDLYPSPIPTAAVDFETW